MTPEPDPETETYWWGTYISPITITNDELNELLWLWEVELARVAVIDAQGVAKTALSRYERAVQGLERFKSVR